ncbi:hypothetical protein Hanom_Chr04g00365651 [Helianthus anomalus]
MKEVVYSKKMKTGFIIYYEGLKDNPSDSKEALRERAVVLSQFEEDVENDIIIESCLDTVDLITLHEELANYQKFHDATFEEIITWFIPSFLGIFKERVMPPTLLDGREDGIAFKCGYKPDDAQVVKIAYIYYLELVEWYFDFMKRKKEKDASDVIEEKSNGWVEDDSSDDDLGIVVRVTDNNNEK